MRIGEALVGEGLVTPTQVEAGLRMQQSYGGRLASTLVELGYVDGDQATRTLAKLRKVPAALQKHFEAAERSVLAKVPKRVVEKYLAVPLGWASEGTLICAMIEPNDLLALEELRFLTGAKVVPGIALELRVRRALEQWYGAARKNDHGFVAMGGGEGLRDFELEQTGHAATPARSGRPPAEAYRAPAASIDLTLDVPAAQPVTERPPGLARPSPSMHPRPELTLDPGPPPSQRPSVSPRRTHPPPLRRDDPEPETRPSARAPAAMPIVSSYDSAHAAMATARGLDQQLDILLAWLRSTFEAALVFEVRNDIAFSSRGFGPAVRGQPPRVAVPLTQPSMLVVPYEARTTFFGVPPDEGEELHKRIWNALGTSPPREALALPVIVEGSVDALVYAHPRKGERIAPHTLIEIANLCAAIARGARM